MNLHITWIWIGISPLHREHFSKHILFHYSYYQPLIVLNYFSLIELNYFSLIELFFIDWVELFFIGWVELFFIDVLLFIITLLWNTDNPLIVFVFIICFNYSSPFWLWTTGFIDTFLSSFGLLLLVFVLIRSTLCPFLLFFNFII